MLWRKTIICQIDKKIEPFSDRVKLSYSNSFSVVWGPGNEAYFRRSISFYFSRARFGAAPQLLMFDVTWSYVKRQTAKMTSEFVFFSSNPPLNDIKIEKCLLLFATNTNIFTLLFKELKTDGKSFIFAVCRLRFDHVTSNLISLIT